MPMPSRRSPWSVPAPAAWRRRRPSFPISATSRAACGRRRSAGRPRVSARAARAPMQRHEGGYYIRLLARDRPGTAATIATRLAEQNISLESIVQRHRGARPHGGDDPRTGRRAGAGRSSSPMRRARTQCAGRSRRSAATGVICGQAAGHPDREELNYTDRQFGASQTGHKACRRLPSSRTWSWSAFSRSRSCA